MYNWHRYLEEGENSHAGSLTCGAKASMVRKAKWKSLEFPLPKKLVNQKQYRISGGISETRATIKDLKGAEHLPLTLLSASAEDRWIVKNES